MNHKNRRAGGREGRSEAERYARRAAKAAGVIAGAPWALLIGTISALMVGAETLPFWALTLAAAVSLAVVVYAILAPEVGSHASLVVPYMARKLREGAWETLTPAQIQALRDGGSIRPFEWADRRHTAQLWRAVLEGASEKNIRRDVLDDAIDRFQGCPDPTGDLLPSDGASRTYWDAIDTARRIAGLSTGWDTCHLLSSPEIRTEVFATICATRDPRRRRVLIQLLEHTITDAGSIQPGVGASTRHLVEGLGPEQIRVVEDLLPRWAGRGDQLLRAAREL